MTKEEFLNRYNQSRSIEEALKKSIAASVQHNKLYINVFKSERQIIRNKWSTLLVDLYQRFLDEEWDVPTYENEIIELKRKMNHFFDCKIHFRISHSQKSISVFFKHLWCLDIIPTPPQCPVDRIISSRARAPHNQRKWGFIDNIKLHRERYNLIKQVSIIDGYINVSEWELENFN
jgi:hypothetical protein